MTLVYNQKASVSTPAKYPGVLQGLVARVGTPAILRARAQPS
jgi:hypothetical protein